MEVNEGAVPGRREVLKKAAVIGGIAWTAPLVLSSAAHAQGSPGGPPVEPQDFAYRIEFAAADIPEGESSRPTGEVTPDTSTTCEPADFGAGSWDDALDLPGFCVSTNTTRAGDIVTVSLSVVAQGQGFAIGSAAAQCSGLPSCVLDGDPAVTIAGDGSSVTFDVEQLCPDAALRILLIGPACV